MAKTKVSKGDKVKVDYEGRLESGEVFDSSTHGDHSHPLEFTAGEGQVIPGFDNALIGMKLNEEKEITIKPEDAYGQPNPEMVRDIPRNVLPKDQEPKVGMMLGMMTPNGQQMAAKIVEVTKDNIKIDLNHPLAGQTLIFKVKVVEII